MSNRGSGGVIIRAVSGSRNAGDPEHVRDMSLLGRARDQLQRQAAAKRIAGEDSGFAARVLMTVKGLILDIGRRPLAVMTANQRAMCLRILRLDALPPAIREVPEVLRVLPMTPPRRRPEPDGDD